MVTSRNVSDQHDSSMTLLDLEIRLKQRLAATFEPRITLKLGVGFWFSNLKSLHIMIKIMIGITVSVSSCFTCELFGLLGFWQAES